MVEVTCIYGANHPSRNRHLTAVAGGLYIHHLLHIHGGIHVCDVCLPKHAQVVHESGGDLCCSGVGFDHRGMHLFGSWT